MTSTKWFTLPPTLLLAAIGPLAKPYPFLHDIISLSVCINPAPPTLLTFLRKITTPLDVNAWEACLRSHPDRVFVNLILKGISEGFRVGFSYQSQHCTPADSNHPSANEHPSVISEALKGEVEKGRLCGPLNPADFPFIQISSLGAVPKKHSNNKWRLILDLSHLRGSSVNDGISRNLCSLTYEGG